MQMQASSDDAVSQLINRTGLKVQSMELVWPESSAQTKCENGDVLAQ